jgi:hypothetical protein
MAVNGNVLAVLFTSIFCFSVLQVSAFVRHGQNFNHRWFISRLRISCYGFFLLVLVVWRGVLVDPPPPFASGVFSALLDQVPIHAQARFD